MITSRSSCAALVLFGFASVWRPALAQDATLVAPEAGDRVIVYTNRFKPEVFAAAKTIMIEGFAEAMEGHGESRLSFFLVDEEASEVINISFFLNEANVETWQAAVSRLEVVKRLDPMRREPLIVRELRLERTHAVP